jgi:hypothetical protein
MFSSNEAHRITKYGYWMSVSNEENLQDRHFEEDSRGIRYLTFVKANEFLLTRMYEYVQYDDYTYEYLMVSDLAKTNSRSTYLLNHKCQVLMNFCQNACLHDTIMISET